jgi:hypothetical protein
MIEGPAIVYFTREKLISVEDQLDETKIKINSQDRFLENLNEEIAKRKK